jgi:hypothetical protein
MKSMARRREEMDWGVAVNVKVKPPSLVVGVMEGSLELKTLKSEARPVVGPELDCGNMVHTMGTPARGVLPRLHDNEDVEADGVLVKQRAPRYPSGQV